MANRTAEQLVTNRAVQDAVCALVVMLKESGALDRNTIARVCDTIISKFDALDLDGELKEQYKQDILFMMAERAPPPTLTLIEGGKASEPD